MAWFLQVHLAQRHVLGNVDRRSAVGTRAEDVECVCISIGSFVNDQFPRRKRKLIPVKLAHWMLALGARVLNVLSVLLLRWFRCWSSACWFRCRLVGITGSVLITGGFFIVLLCRRRAQKILNQKLSNLISRYHWTFVTRNRNLHNTDSVAWITQDLLTKAAYEGCAGNRCSVKKSARR